MNSPRTLLLQNKEAVAKINAMLVSNEFALMMTYARAEFSLRNPSTEQGVGAALLENIIISLVDPETEQKTWAEATSDSMLQHNLEVPIRTKPATTKTE
jgi:hypothetical protein